MNKAFITGPGDPSVGIPSHTTTVDFDGLEIEDPLELDSVRKSLEKCFSDIYGEKVHVHFDTDRVGEPEYQ